MRTIKKFTERSRAAAVLCVALAALLAFPGAQAEDVFAQEAQALLDSQQTDLPADLEVGYLASEGAEINPVYCTERDLVSINQLVFESVVELDDTQKPVPLLADSWTVEGNVWTFRMRSGIQFHNGLECLAQDVVASYESLLAAGSSNPYYGRLTLIESMTALDSLTLQVTGRFSGMITLYAMTFPVMERSTLAPCRAAPARTGIFPMFPARPSAWSATRCGGNSSRKLKASTAAAITAPPRPWRLCKPGKSTASPRAPIPRHSTAG